MEIDKIIMPYIGRDFKLVLREKKTENYIERRVCVKIEKVKTKIESDHHQTHSRQREQYFKLILRPTTIFYRWKSIRHHQKLTLPTRMSLYYYDVNPRL